jgi:hypothetical protein
MLLQGEWVHATTRLDEKDFPRDGLCWIHAEPGDIGMVLDSEDAGWVNIYWERTGSVTLCHVDDLRRPVTAITQSSSYLKVSA